MMTESPHGGKHWVRAAATAGGLAVAACAHDATLAPRDVSAPAAGTALARAPYGPPPLVPAPFFGDFSSATGSVWRADQAPAVSWYDLKGSNMHKDFGTFDDSEAYDWNLKNDLDQNLPVVSPFSGTVIRYGTTFPGTASGGTYGAVLVKFGATAMGCMHLTRITVTEGATVTAGQVLGAVSDVGAGAKHLHCAFYDVVQQANRTTKLVSHKVTIVPRNFSLALPSRVVVGGTPVAITARVPFFDGRYTINDPYFANSTYWTSDNKAVAVVSGDGVVRRVKSGATVVRLRFAGKEFVVPVTVQ